MWLNFYKDSTNCFYMIKEELMSTNANYNRFLSNHKFATKKDFNYKANIVAIKILVLLGTIEFITLAGIYVFTIYIVGDEMAFKYFFLQHLKELYLQIAIATIFIVSIYSRVFMAKFYKFVSQKRVTSSKKIHKMLELSKTFPLLAVIIKKRLESNGYFSEMDYRSLKIGTIYKHLEKSKTKYTKDN